MCHRRQRLDKVVARSNSVVERNGRGSRLHGARLYGAFGLTWEQIDRAWIDEWTRLPEELEELRKQKLERQQSDSENDFIELEEDSEADQEDTDAEPNE